MKKAGRVLGQPSRTRDIGICALGIGTVVLSFLLFYGLLRLIGLFPIEDKAYRKNGGGQKKHKTISGTRNRRIEFHNWAPTSVHGRADAGQLGQQPKWLRIASVAALMTSSRWSPTTTL
ncbi:hypothetical protein [Bradyrhizobium iriomotense]|uniref:Uncharacterized protein n=1 Tax=Bradyrhizobium iriomotense TaxID=441950 RepID=A0ABQ6B9B5_9BRAD|nr:hypothetical protein [Bradyrhizobium iriomotense]GLR90965.1 hypothetical protein GCM10007857_76810 [Bradyrhizobium iriomotense]